jgi:hypothetical protein
MRHERWASQLRVASRQSVSARLASKLALDAALPRLWSAARQAE